ncbi:carbon-nitrogen hydrolase family protein [Microbacterium esteraromaticum]|uniref:carbon-nitrogen hydrolase family protein n=1 Tax=Microbacterium esteraromaticum TaxID=57043 RepID=UPI0019D3BFE0|nr:carbon-nitrogen hydrolase family protein [Microbacterium esteraromaticum]MBN7794783.1 carbon-nitrogen hydrolase family protein [Microbacterium esteraromaticum]
MGERLRVGAVQLHSPLSPAECAVQCGEWIAAARKAALDLLVLPESASSRTDDPAETPVAEPLDGPFVQSLIAALDGSGLTVIAGITESAGDRPFNTVVVVDATGIRAVYRKLHLYDAAGMRESDAIRPGEHAPPVIDVGGFGVGVMTCYDIRFPETARALALQGADVLAVPTSWVRGPLKEAHWSTFCAARALESTCFVIGAGQTGGTRIGCSMIVAPDGTTMASAGVEQTLLVTEFDRARVDAARTAFPLLAQRRFELDLVPRPPELVTGVRRHDG